MPSPLVQSDWDRRHREAFDDRTSRACPGSGIVVDLLVWPLVIFSTWMCAGAAWLVLWPVYASTGLKRPSRTLLLAVVAADGFGPLVGAVLPSSALAGFPDPGFWGRYSTIVGGTWWPLLSAGLVGLLIYSLLARDPRLAAAPAGWRPVRRRVRGRP